ncbi:MAG: hypothetical protein LBT05_04160 [Planctomycetaceae bacterium]|jgi:DNA-binding beta-propeller fold protein YncE|nr:hypothetical protein [Planctomycetaceae bacterium]
MTNQNTDPQNKLTEDIEPTRKDSFKILKKILQKHKQHSYTPLIIVILSSLVFGFLALYFIPNKEKPMQADQRIARQSFPDNLIGFFPETSFSISDDFSLPMALAAFSENEILVGGLNVQGNQCRIILYSKDGKKQKETPLPAIPTDLLIPKEGELFLGNLLIAFSNNIGVYDREGNLLKTISAPKKEDAFFTSLAADGEHLWVADALQSKIYRFDLHGQLNLTIEKEKTLDAEKKPFPGFGANNFYLGISLDSQKNLWVADAKNGRLVPFDKSGQWLSSQIWGTHGSSSENDLSDQFFGDNNPISLAFFQDGRVLTIEKDVNRVKIFTPEHTFQSLAASPGFFYAPSYQSDGWFSEEKNKWNLDHENLPVPVLKASILSNNKVILLDQINLKVHFFTEK